jgi:hypothetical protein
MYILTDTKKETEKQREREREREREAVNTFEMILS